MPSHSVTETHEAKIFIPILKGIIVTVHLPQFIMIRHIPNEYQDLIIYILELIHKTNVHN